MAFDGENMYRMYDNVSETCVGQVLLCKTDPPAIRIFHDVIRDKNSMLNQHPEDFDLICIGCVGPKGDVFDNIRRVVATGRSYAEAVNAQQS